MTATFLTTLDIGTEFDLQLIADQIHDELEKEFTVVEVKPWARQNLSPSTQTPPDVSGQPK